MPTTDIEQMIFLYSDIFPIGSLEKMDITGLLKNLN